MAPSVDDRALPGVTVINCLLGAIALVVVCLRIYTRAWIKPSLGWDDFLIVLGLIFGIAYTVGQLIQVYFGHYGHHKAYLTQQEWIIIWKWNAVVNTILPASSFCSRASICFFLLRLLNTIRRWRIAIFIALILNTCVATGTIVMYGIECVPISREWDMQEPEGFCVNREAFDIIVKFFSSLNCVVDFMCAGIPFVAMQTVRLDRKTRYGLYLILCCGIVTAACSIGRSVSLDFKSPDPTWTLVPLSYWTAAEMYGTIIFASLPALRQLLSLLYRKASSNNSPSRRARSPWRRTKWGFRGRAQTEPTEWTYSPDSGGFGSFMHSAGASRHMRHSEPELTGTGCDEAYDLASVSEDVETATQTSTSARATSKTGTCADASLVGEGPSRQTTHAGDAESLQRFDSL